MSIWANVATGPALPTRTVDAVVVGSGPAGWTAAIYLARACADVVVLTGTAVGGQLMDTGIVENFPGFPDGIDGPDLMARMREQAERAGATVLTLDAHEIRYATEGGSRGTAGRKAGREAVHEVVTADGTLRTRAVVLATGSAPRRLGLPGEAEMGGGLGVAYCAVCEAPLFKGRDVAVVGGGDSAMEEVLALARHARRVHLIHRGDRFRATPVLLERVRALSRVRLGTGTGTGTGTESGTGTGPDVRTGTGSGIRVGTGSDIRPRSGPDVRTGTGSEVRISTGSVVRALRAGSDGRLAGLSVEHTATGEVTDLAVQGLFVAIGHTPRSRLADGRLSLTATGHLHTTGPGGATELPGIFVAGDVADDRFRQAVTAAGAGCAAALEATRYLEGVHA